WVKVDIRSKAAPIRVLGPRMGIQSRQAVVVVYTDQRADQVFDETGPGTLLIRDDAATRTGKETQTNQFFVREERSDPVTQPCPPDVDVPPGPHAAPQTSETGPPR